MTTRLAREIDGIHREPRRESQFVGKEPVCIVGKAEGIFKASRNIWIPPNGDRMSEVERFVWMTRTLASEILLWAMRGDRGAIRRHLGRAGSDSCRK